MAWYSGLGIGTSQNGLMRQNIETDIVEIDPAIYHYSKDYFGLLPNHTVYIMDAVKFVANASAVENPEKYEYIIHDVFTGGAAPSALFTKEMVGGMEKILSKDGVIAIVSLAGWSILRS